VLAAHKCAKTLTRLGARFSVLSAFNGAAMGMGSEGISRWTLVSS
jgi:hypothetical protein